MLTEYGERMSGISIENIDDMEDEWLLQLIEGKLEQNRIT